MRDGLKWAGEDVERIHVCVAGGRKTMPIDAVLVCMAEGIRNVYHDIAPRIPGVSQEFANLVAGKIDRLKVGGLEVPRGELLDRLERYAERPGDADEGIVRFALKACFPPKGLEFYLVRMPVPRLPEEERKRFSREIA